MACLTEKGGRGSTRRMKGRESRVIKRALVNDVEAFKGLKGILLWTNGKGVRGKKQNSTNSNTKKNRRNNNSTTTVLIIEIQRLAITTLAIRSNKRWDRQQQ